jgi:small conductance mechanosensitive channel
MINWQELLQKGVELVILYSPKLVTGLIVLFIGLWIVKLLTKLTAKTLQRSKVDHSLEKFVTDLVTVLLKILVFISVASMVGIKMTSFIAILSSMAFAVGLAMQGSLGNFAGGVLIILFKPFKVGDLIEAQGYTAVVSSIQVFHTVLKTADNKTIILPNGPLSNGTIMNYSTEGNRRVDLVFGISYDANFKDAQKVITDIVADDKRILKDPAPFARVGELAESSVNIIVRVWVKAEDYWDVHFDLIETVKSKFEENKIEIPYPHIKIIKD